MTDNITKLYEVAGIACKDLEYCKDCIYLKNNQCINKQEFIEDCLPFTAEKQLELIKWLSQNFDIVRFWVEHSEYIAEIDGVFDVDKEFNQALAGLILGLWKDLTDDQKQEIKRILQWQINR